MEIPWQDQQCGILIEESGKHVWEEGDGRHHDEEKNSFWCLDVKGVETVSSQSLESISKILYLLFLQPWIPPQTPLINPMSSLWVWLGLLRDHDLLRYIRTQQVPIKQKITNYTQHCWDWSNRSSTLNKWMCQTAICSWSRPTMLSFPPLLCSYEAKSSKFLQHLAKEDLKI